MVSAAHGLEHYASSQLASGGQYHPDDKKRQRARRSFVGELWNRQEHEPNAEHVESRNKSRTSQPKAAHREELFGGDACALDDRIRKPLEHRAFTLNCQFGISRANREHAPVGVRERLCHRRRLERIERRARDLLAPIEYQEALSREAGCSYW